MATANPTIVKRSKLAVVLGALFVIAGATKLLGWDLMVAMFQSWGYTADFRLLVGAIELFAGVGLMFPMTARYAALALMPIMIGAAYTHVFRGTWLLAAIVPLLFLMLLMYVAARPWTPRRRGGWPSGRRAYSS